MSLSNCARRPALYGHVKNVFINRRCSPLDNISLFNRCSLSTHSRSTGQTSFILKFRNSALHFRKYHLLLNEIENNTKLKGLPSSGTLCTVSSNQDSEQENGRSVKRGLLSHNSFRHDRQRSAELFRNIIEEKGDNAWTTDDWVRVGEQLSLQLTSSWEVMCMHTLMTDCNIAVGRSLMNFLEGRLQPPGPVITTFFIGLLGKTCHGNPEQELEFKKYYDGLVSVTDIFDAASIEVLVEGFSYTKHYRECIKLLEMYKLTSHPGSSILRNMLMGALRNEDMDLCSLVLQSFEEDIEPSQITQLVPAAIDIAIESKNQDSLLKIFDFMQKHSLSLPKNHLETIVESFQRSDSGQWKGLFGFVNYKSGKCSVCGHQLPRIHLEAEEFKAVQSAFLDQVIVSDNIFFKTSPEEVENFMEFVKERGPFDVVIDGMNALYAATRNKASKETLERLMSHYCDSNKRILILGSKVLASYIKGLHRFRPKPAVFMSSTTRADDAFFLYAALHSGMNTVIVSADKLRDHQFKLEPKLKHVFHRWLMLNRVYNFMNARTGVISPKQHMYNLGPIKDDRGWHIPVNDVDMRNPFGRQGILCLRHGPENFVRLPDRSFNSHRAKPKRTQRTFSNKDWFDL